jgi:deoxyadenosine/deoxycytidine kinase
MLDNFLNISFAPQQEKYKKVKTILEDPNKKFIVIDGVISAGKTTLIRLLEEKLNQNTNANTNINTNTTGIGKVKAIYEPVDLWNSTGALKYFYEDIPKRAYEFQTYTYITRIARIIDEIANCPDADIYLLERSIWTDRYIFMELLKEHVGDLRMTMYNQWCDLWAYILPMQIDKWVFLDTSLEESLRRIKVRNREAESGISAEYQSALYNKHVEFYNQLKNQGCPVLIIENNLMDDNFITNQVTLDKITDMIIKF